MKTLIEQAKDFARKAHDSIGQKRKYTLEPYWVHTEAVADLVATRTSDESVIAAANLHDALEDVAPVSEDFTAYVLLSKFGTRVFDLVVELTDIYTHDKFPELNRAERKRLEAIRISKCSEEAKLIKRADMFDNTSSIMQYDPGFAKVYLEEKAYLESLIGRWE